MPRGKAATFDAQRANILQTAAQLFAERGFAGTSMANVAAACGVSKALLYHYYRAKEHLLFDTADSYLDSLIAIVAQVRAQRLAPQEHFSALIDRFMQAYEHSQAQHAVLVQDVKFLGAIERGKVIDKERAVVEAFAQAIARLKPRFSAPALRVPLAMILFGMINWTFTWLRPDGPLKHTDIAQVVTDIFLTGVTTAPGRG